jgi:hypothetical protein
MRTQDLLCVTRMLQVLGKAFSELPPRKTGFLIAYPARPDQPQPWWLREDWGR